MAAPQLQISGLALAKRLLDKHGRDVVLRKPGPQAAATPPTYVTFADLQAGAAVDADDASHVELTVRAACIELSTSETLADRSMPSSDAFVTKNRKHYLIAGIEGVDIEEYLELIDGSRTYRVEDAHRFAPGEIDIIYSIEVQE